MKITTLLFAILTATTLQGEQTSPPASLNATESKGPYQVKDYSYLKGMEGFSDKTLETHFKLYEGYVKNTNLLLDILSQLGKEEKETSPQFGAIKRRVGFEYDGIYLHELYFSNLGGKDSILDKASSLYQQIVKDFGSYDAWQQNFINTGMMRGIGWVILYRDPLAKRLMNVWISEHQDNHLAGAQPILIMDVWEHAYMLDYGIDRMAYIKAFFNNINWDVVADRYGK